MLYCGDVMLLVECCFTSTETVGLLGTAAQDGHLNSHTAPELSKLLFEEASFKTSLKAGREVQ